MKIWHCMWANEQDVECLRDDLRNMDARDLANPVGVLLENIDDIDRVMRLVVEEDRDMHETCEGYVEDEWTLESDGPEHRIYGYKDYCLRCELKEVL